MKFAYLLIAHGLIFPACKAQQASWSDTKNWKVYVSAGPAVFTIPADSLSLKKSNSLNDDSVQFYLKSVQPLPKDREPTWMGAWLGSYETSDGKLRKIEIGTYGGYFYDVSSDRYFSLPRPLIRPWQKFIAKNIPD
jgi:hypothetical protein